MKLYIVGIGAGCRDGMTIQAEKILSSCELIVGYTVYADIVREFYPNKEYYSTTMRKEKERVQYAIEQSLTRDTALVCSGDSELYGMAGLAYELAADYPDAQLETVAGVTAAFSGGAVLGSPLTHDFAVISLSDLLTPWEKIEKRLEYSAAADFFVVLYNPSSKKRSDYLKKACEIMLKHKSSDTVCGIVRNIGRKGESAEIMTLSELCNWEADMFTTIYIGNSETKAINGKMVTPRGYRNV
ncbi:MAG: precorrin-3B C(17)-methyltransferase [Huintestinicola sp.]